MPIYETEANRNHERKIADYVVKKYGGQMKQNDRLADIDYEYISPEGEVRNIEMRCRKIKWGQYPTIFIKAGKLAIALGEYRTGTYFEFIVRTIDSVKVFIPTEHNLHLLKNSWGGRTDRNDPRDVEWVVEIPIHLFEDL